MHSTGHFLAQAVQPMHFSASMLYFKSALHFPAGQVLPNAWLSYSSMKFLMLLITGFGADCPSPQREVALTMFDRCQRLFRSDISASPFAIFSSISYILVVPMRQGVHLPQDSSLVKFK